MEQTRENHLTLEDYNRLEEEQQQRYEYHDGEVFAMAGGDPKHSAIANNVGTLITMGIREKDCVPFNSDAKVYIEKLNKSLYPDFSVVCGSVRRSAKDSKAIENPTLLVEVLSESTRKYDLGEKFIFYSHLSSLKEYVLVEQDQHIVQVYYRANVSENWQMRWFIGADAVVELWSVALEIPVKDIYYKTDI
jgi:Uma2 family endonuclease